MEPVPQNPRAWRATRGWLTMARIKEEVGWSPRLRMTNITGPGKFKSEA